MRHDDVLEIYHEFCIDADEKDAALLTLAEVISSALTNLADATREISHGGLSGPMGLEGLAMAIAGTGLHHSVAESLESIASSIDSVSNSVDGLSTE